MQAGGFLFKTCLVEEKLYIGIIPAISEGERLHHYDINIPDSKHLIGSISATGEFSILFSTEKEELNDKTRKLWRLQYSAFTAVLFALGYSKRGDLDWISQQIIKETNLFDPIPETLSEIRDQFQKMNYT